MKTNPRNQCAPGGSVVDGRSNLRAAVAAGLTLAVVVFAACEDDLAAPLSVDGTGTLTGLVFFDVEEDGVFDPLSGDIPLGDVGLAVQARGTGETFAGGTTTTDDDGRFSIAALPAGTHDLFVDTLTVPEEVSICQNPLQVTVNLDESRFAEVRGRPGCLITIAEAKELPQGTFAIVRGTVTSSPGQVENGWLFIQDETAGAKVNGGLDGLGIEIGDQVELGGVTGQFVNDFEFQNSVFRSLVEDVGEIAPQVVTTGQIAASGASFTDPLQGLFIRLEAAELVAAFGSGGMNIQNGTIDDGTGATTIRIDDGVADRNELNDILTVGLCYDINGFGANFAGAGQIFPRSLDDIEEVPCN